MKVNVTKDIKVYVDEIGFNFRENGHHRSRPSGLFRQWVNCCGQAMKPCSGTKFCTF